MRSSRTLRAACLVVAALIAVPAAAAEPMTVFAAASLKNALDEAGKAFTAESGIPVRASYAASSALARQIEQGAPADLFASADLEWMDYLAARKLVRPETRVNLLGNRLVVVAPKDCHDHRGGVHAGLVRPDARPRRTPRHGEVNSVPIGKYAKAAFETLGLWAPLQFRLAQADNVRAALALVSRGEAPLGVVYESDAKSDRA